MLVQELLTATQCFLQVFRRDTGQFTCDPCHLLLHVSVELEQYLPGIQGLPATLQGSGQAVVPETNVNTDTQITFKYDRAPSAGTERNVT